MKQHARWLRAVPAAVAVGIRCSTSKISRGILAICLLSAIGLAFAFPLTSGALAAEFPYSGSGSTWGTPIALPGGSTTFTWAYRSSIEATAFRVELLDARTFTLVDTLVDVVGFGTNGSGNVLPDPLPAGNYILNVIAPGPWNVVLTVADPPPPPPPPPETPSTFLTRIVVNGSNPLPDGSIHWYRTSKPLVGFLASGTVEPDPVDPVKIGGFEYTLRQNGGLSSYVAYTPVGSEGGPLANDTVDLVGWVARQDVPIPSMAGAVDPIEGWWAIEANILARDYPSLTASGPSHTAGFGIDVTPPSLVGTISVISSITPAGQVVGSVAQFGWPDNAAGNLYDQLSREWAWAVKLNGNVVGTFPRVRAQAPTATVTIENLAVGANLVEIAAVDEAGNTGPYRTVAVSSRPVPRVTFTQPTGSSLISRGRVTAVVSSTLANPVVTISLDDTVIGTFTSAPYSVIPDLSGLIPGTHTLSATVVDSDGGAGSTSKDVWWAPSEATGFETRVTVNGDVLPDTYFTWYRTPQPLVSLLASNTVSGASGDPIVIGGFNYQLWRSGGVSTNSAYTPVESAGGQLAQEAVDLTTWVEMQTGTLPPGGVAAIEGHWYLGANSVAIGPLGPRIAPPEGAYNVVDFGIDVTPPSRVCTAVVTSVVTSQGVVPGTSVFVAWPINDGGVDYDKLSGTWGWTAKLNGAEITTFPQGSSTVPTATLSVSGLVVGANLIEIAAVDRAGNIGTYRELWVYSRPSPPTIALTEPTGSALIVAAPITAVVTPAVGVIDPFITIRLDGAVIATGTATTVTTVPDLTHLASGTHTLTATVVDRFGNSATATKTVTWSPPVPTVSFITPAGSALTVGEAIAASVVSEHGSSPAVTIRIDGTSIGAFSAPPYSVVPDLRGLSAGSHVISVSATNDYGITTISKTVTWSPPVPTITITSPSGSSLTADQAIAANVTSTYGNPSVTIGLDGGTLASFSASPYSVVPDLTGVSAGSHVIKVSATNDYGTATVSKTVSWSPPVPTVTWTSPTSTFLTLMTPISVDVASGWTPTVSIAIDSTVHSFAAPPYSFTPDLNLLPAGSHVLRATATNKYGTTSITKTVTWDPSGSNGFVRSDDPVLNTKPVVLSSTNPSDTDDKDAWWRMGWGNSVTPDFDITPPTTNNAGVGYVIGMLYSLDRSSSSEIDVTQPQKYFRTARGEGTHLVQTLDVLGTLAHPPTGGWPALMPGANLPEEGYWYYHLAFFTAKGFASKSWYGPFGIDRTPPTAVQGLKASPTLDTADADKWTESSRANALWQAGKYDSLAGVGYYELLLDDEPIIPNSGIDPTQGRVYEIPGQSPSSITVEDMPPGKHKVSIVAVDRATNAGPAASTYFYSDPSIPTVQLTSPGSSSTRLNGKSALTAATADSGAVSSVQFSVDGAVVGTVKPSTITTSYPASFTPVWSRFGNGTHTVTVTVFDMMGRSAKASSSFVLDKVAPSLSVTSRGPSPFYPRKRDGYKDNYVVKFKTNKACTATMLVYDPSGGLARTVVKNVKAGTNTLSWNGVNSTWAWGDGTITKTYKYRVKVQLRDAAGNTRTSSTYPAWMKFYEIVKPKRGAARVINR